MRLVSQEPIKSSIVPTKPDFPPKVKLFFDRAEYAIARMRTLVQLSGLLVEDLEALLYKTKGLLITVVLLLHSLILLTVVLLLKAGH
jgi:hypothetical protein